MLVADEDVNHLLRKRRFAGAFELVLQRYQNKVFRLAFSILRERSRAEDATQDTFVKFWQALPDYDGRAAVSTWLYTIARNTCLSAARAQTYRTTETLVDALEPRAKETISKITEVHDFLLRLPAVEREVVTLFYLQERSIRDLSQMLNMPEGTVKSHLHRARRTLAEWMEK
ncbi:MAG TPA: RNA polymerase sigma factor [Candidatus Acidoferrum sp.]|nr:RNA polymerase sigma factor [Candidatus Acidoferrum sp.]